MAFQINLSPLERSSRGIGQGLVNIGNVISDSMRRNQAQEYKNQAQGDIDAFMAQALSGDPVALKELMVRDPQRAQYVAQQLQQGIDKEQGEIDRFQGERALATADIVEKIAFAKSPEEATMIFNAGVDDPKFDLDEDDRNIYTNRGKQKALIAEVKGQEYADNLFGEKTKFSQGTGKMSGYVFNPDSGEFTVNQELKDKVDLAVKSDYLDPKLRQSINKDFTALTKGTTAIRNTAADVEKLAKIGTGPASIAIVYKFMKALDPTSVVKADEFATAENSAGVPSSISNMYNKLLSGERLGPEQLAQFVETAKKLANSSITSSTVEIDRYLNTFENTLTPKFKALMRDRIPVLFDVSPDQVGGKGENNSVIMTHPTKGDITEAMIQSTMSKRGMTREQVITKLGEK